MFTRKVFLLLPLVLLFSEGAAFAQGTAFTFQGKLGDSGTPVNGSFDMQFKLFDAADPTNSNQIGSTITLNNPLVQVTNGVFDVQLDFGAAAFPGADRFLEIGIRSNSTDPYTVLSPRSKITSSPYAIRSLKATEADGLSPDCAGCIQSSQINSVDASKLTGTVPPSTISASNLPPGSSNYIQTNRGALGPQPGASFDISGSGHMTGTLRIEANGLIVPDSPSLSLSANGSFQIDAPFLPGGRLAVLPDGNVGIGNGAPGEKLDVAGNIKFSGSIKGDGSGLMNVTAQTTTNASLLGQLRWDLLSPRSFPVPGTLWGVAFDGANIWVVDAGSNSCLKLRPSDGAIIGTFAVGVKPFGVAFDGANIWVSNINSNNVTKLRASDGANLGTFAVGAQPRAVAFDGANVWVSNFGSNDLTKLRASDGVNLGTFAVGTQPRGLAFDGANIWVANVGSGNVTKLRASDGATLNTFVAGASPNAVAFDGANIWVANLGSHVTKLRASDGTVIGTFSVGTTPEGIAFDGANIWVANFDSNTVTKLRASDGTTLNTFAAGNGPLGVAFDGANIWVSSNSGVTRIPPFR